ncbi:helix-turn-helix domain-containing protein [Lactiplantibacillus plantarum]|uniref:helix-turn-helix domain-containing protein n=2 Tax=Lactiplantibacillus plantarum TaxID=1590 RepID=UPI001BB97382|nr:helix-turn-helix domain-containing protein [Lactiplantibacillus plantarum]MBS0945817.1 helix-turn-helix transcriptional regulator [Lactiplantibacillus plantarum]
MMLVKEYLSENDISMYQVAKKSNISESTINSAGNKAIDKLSVRVLSAIAVVAGMTPGELLDDMLNYETGGTA